MATIPEFEHLGYFKEYYIGNKLIGQTRCEKDREKTGYAGRIISTIKEPIILENGKRIKVGQLVMTMIYPLNGKIISR